MAERILAEIEAILRGAARLIDPFGYRRYRPEQSDLEALKSDWAHVGAHLHGAMSEMDRRISQQQPQQEPRQRSLHFPERHGASTF